MDSSDGRNILWAVLSYIFVVVGIILTLVWWQDRRTNAKASLVGFVISLIVVVIYQIVKMLTYAIISGLLIAILIKLLLDLLIFIGGLVFVILYAKKLNE